MVSIASGNVAATVIVLLLEVSAGKSDLAVSEAFAGVVLAISKSPCAAVPHCKHEGSNWDAKLAWVADDNPITTGYRLDGKR